MPNSLSFIEPTLRDCREILRQMSCRKVVVIGDVMLDSYLLGNVERISPEAPVPVFNIENKQSELGGAANVAKCLRMLGANVWLCSVVGDDPEGELIRWTCSRIGIEPQLVVDKSRPTTHKTRVVAHSQQMVRLDQESRQPLSEHVEESLIDLIGRVTFKAEVIVLSDYAKGVLTPYICRFLQQNYSKFCMVVDPKGNDWNKYRGARVIKPNLDEACRWTGLKNDGDITIIANNIYDELEIPNVLVTCGSKGMVLKHPEGVLQLPSRVQEVYDVTGAGDVVTAVLSLVLATKNDIQKAAWLANIAAGVKVKKFGATAVTEMEILQALHSKLDCEQKVFSLEQLRNFVQEQQKQARKIVFTNGCFDLLHYGHVSYLERSKKQGDVLIVAVNSDESVRRLKGASRPVQHEQDRARIIAAQACVDAVIIFNEDTPKSLLKILQPDILCKGADYKVKESVVGWEIVESYGGKIALIEQVDGLSTSNIINKFQ